MRHLERPAAPGERVHALSDVDVAQPRGRRSFVDWLREHNARRRSDRARAPASHGLDLYSLYTSIAAVLRYLDGVDPAAAKVARARYGCLTPWQHDPAAYGRAVVTGGYRACEDQVVAMLRDLLDKRLDYQHRDGERFLDALQNARVVANAERYYRAMYYGSRESWNLRDQHMFETLQMLLAFRGPDTKAVVWEHNSHVGDAARDRDGRARRAQRRPARARALRRRRLSGRVRHRPRHGRGGDATGTGRWR